MRDKRKKPQPRKPMTMSSLVDDVLFGTRAAKIATLAVTIGALAYILGVIQPVLDSGPMPFPSREEVVGGLATVSKSLESTQKNLDATLNVAQAALSKASQNEIDQKQNRMQRLIQQRVYLDALIKMNPDELTLKQLHADTENQIARLSAELSTASVPTPGVASPVIVAPVTPLPIQPTLK